MDAIVANEPFGIWTAVHHFGEYGHILLPLYVSVFIVFMKKYLWGFWAFLGVNELLIWILKRTFCEKRPVPISDNPNDFDYYGMPSGHSQHAAFSLMYLCLLLDNVVALMALGFMSMVVMYQRYAAKRHSISQIAAGAIFGLAVGYFAFTITKRTIVDSPLEEHI